MYNVYKLYIYVLSTNSPRRPLAKYLPIYIMYCPATKHQQFLFHESFLLYCIYAPIIPAIIMPCQIINTWIRLVLSRFEVWNLSNDRHLIFGAYICVQYIDQITGRSGLNEFLNLIFKIFCRIRKF